MRAFVGIALLCAGFAPAVLAAADDVPDVSPAAGAEQVLRSLVSERDVALVFDFLRESLIAGVQGREPPAVPEELTGRAEALGQALKAQGALAALALFFALEQRAKDALRDLPAPRPALPPTPPSTRL